MYKDEKGNLLIGRLIGHTLGFIAFMVLFFGSWTIISPGERGILIQLGKVQEAVLQEGLNFKLPLIQKVKKLEE